MRRNEVVLGAVLLAGLTVASFVRFGNDVRPAHAGTTYASDDTQPGGYAAYATLLARERIRVETFVRRPGELDDGLDTLVVAYAPSGAGSVAAARTASDVGDLRDWIARGGRAIVIGTDPRLAAQERAVLGRPPSIGAPAAGSPYAGPLAAHVTALARSGDVRFRVAPRARVLLRDRGGVLAVDVPLGRGVVRYVADGEAFTNAAIGRADNARLAYALAQPRRRAGTIAFDESIHGALADLTWWSILPIWLRIAFLGWALTLALALAGGALRLGPPLPPRTREPTSSAFLDAVTALYERARVSPDER